MAKKKTTRRKPTQAQTDNTGKLFKEIYFPTQIYYRDLPDAKRLNRKIKRHIYAWRDEDPDGIVRSNVKKAGAWHSPTDMNRRPEYQELVALITESMGHIFRNLQYHPGSEPVCDNMWANISPPHGFNRYHTHPNVLWSGVYYVQAPKNSGRIFFIDPRAQAHAVTPRYHEGARNVRESWSEVYYQPVEGRMILFPAWLAHEVEPNMSTAKDKRANRISISFNYIQRRRTQ